MQEKLVDLKASQPMGSLIGEASKHAALAEEAWEALPVAVAAVADALVDTERTTPQGNLGYLRITSEQRTGLLSQVKDLFGEEVASGTWTAGLSYPRGAASLPQPTLARFRGTIAIRAPHTPPGDRESPAARRIALRSIVDDVRGRGLSRLPQTSRAGSRRSRPRCSSAVGIRT